jgi:hypothetical protein
VSFAANAAASDIDAVLLDTTPADNATLASGITHHVRQRCRARLSSFRPLGLPLAEAARVDVLSHELRITPVRVG